MAGRVLALAVSSIILQQASGLPSSDGPVGHSPTALCCSLVRELHSLLPLLLLLPLAAAGGCSHTRLAVE